MTLTVISLQCLDTWQLWDAGYLRGWHPLSWWMTPRWSFTQRKRAKLSFFWKMSALWLEMCCSMFAQTQLQDGNIEGIATGNLLGPGIQASSLQFFRGWSSLMTPHLALPWATGLEISRTSMFHRRIIEPLEGGYRLLLNIFRKTVISFLLFLDACIFCSHLVFPKVLRWLRCLSWAQGAPGAHVRMSRNGPEWCGWCTWNFWTVLPVSSVFPRVY